MLAYSALIKSFLPSGILFLLACTACLFYRPADAARKSAARKTAFWLAGFATWIVLPASFYAVIRDTGISGPALALHTLYFCLPLTPLIAWLVWRDSARRHLYLILSSWCGVALAALACYVVWQDRLELLTPYYQMNGTAMWSPDQLIPIQGGNAALDISDAPLRIPYEDGDATGLVAFYDFEMTVVKTRSDALNALLDRAEKIKKLDNDTRMFADPAALKNAQSKIAQFRAILSENQAIDARFYIEWKAALDRAPLSEATRQRIRADYERSSAVNKAAEKRFEDTQLAIMDLAGSITDLAARGMGANKVNGATISFARDEDRVQYDRLNGQIAAVTAQDNSAAQVLVKPREHLGEMLWRMRAAGLVVPDIPNTTRPRPNK